MNTMIVVCIIVGTILLCIGISMIVTQINRTSALTGDLQVKYQDMKDMIDEIKQFIDDSSDKLPSPDDTIQSYENGTELHIYLVRSISAEMARLNSITRLEKLSIVTARNRDDAMNICREAGILDHNGNTSDILEEVPFERGLWKLCAMGWYTGVI